MNRMNSVRRIPATFHNPILPGFHPDPSICRAGDDYFLVNSSFAYFPGVPLFHSRDLVHWRQIGACLDRAEQLPMQSKGVSSGIFAPTIRYHQGVFYMITTNVAGGGNFYVTTRDPFASWSDPTWVEQPGIDPSLLFDNGRVYLTSTGMTGDPGQQGQGILQSEIDMSTGGLLTKTRLIWTGTGGSFPEGPHLYHIGGIYYLMIAEGGTEYGHCEVIARSAAPWGPWESCPHNPILTHRSTSHPIQAIGHADLLEAADGSWWAVCLGVRPVFPQAQHLGRETFLAPVTWDLEGWPQIGNSGRIELEMESPFLVPVLWEPTMERDHFDSDRLGMKWNFLGVPAANSWSLRNRQGTLCLLGNATGLDDGMGVSWVGCRQEHFNCEASTLLDFNPTHDGDEAGLTIWKDPRHHYDFFITRQDGNRLIRLRRRIGSLCAVQAEMIIPEGSVTLQVRANRLFYSFFSWDAANRECQISHGETRYLSSEVAGGFTGVYFGLYTFSSARVEQTPAYFDWFDYRITEKPGILSVDSSLALLLRNDKARQVLGRHLPGLLAHSPVDWGAKLSLLGLAALAQEDFSPEKIQAVDAELQKKKISCQEEASPLN